ncbi:dUTP diphosphatase [Jeotgalicoccus halotolerans]|uniref:dUTP diphosphatase n=1 Tax=Jeotgalicoccus halotolerans TaxID=157227 RepID=UPI003517CB6D
MIKNMLTKADLQYLLTQQEKLDKDIREKKGITLHDWNIELNRKHFKAMKIETAEFVNEMHDVWKYWKDKPVDKNKILDEGVDVIHFCCLIINKTGRIVDSVETKLLDEINLVASWYEFEKMKADDEEEVINGLQDDMLSKIVDVYEYFAHVLILLGLYGFTSKDIIDQYNIKNKENFRRLESGY